MSAHIYSPTKTAMQSGRGKAKEWILEIEKSAAILPDDIIGWCGSNDTDKQVILHFDTLEQAEQYAKAHQLAYHVTKPKERKIKPKAYADNFAYGRKQPWTH